MRTGFRGQLTYWLSVLLLVLPTRLAMATDPPFAYVAPPPANLVLPTTPGEHKLKFTTKIGSRKVTMPYLLKIPPDYGRPGQPRPLLVFLHGAGECGTDLAGLYVWGPLTLFPHDGMDSVNPVLARTWPFVTLCPQCPPRGEAWSDEFMYQAADELVAAVVHSASGRIDADRVYATGLSMGGLGVWCMAEQNPDLFAAVAPLSAMDWQPRTAGQKLRFVSAWSVTGLTDEFRFIEGARAMQQALARDPAPSRFSFMPNEGHEVFGLIYRTPQLYEWLLSHRRPDTSHRDLAVARPSTSPAAVPSTPLTPGHHLLSFQYTLAGQPVDIDYVVFVPQNPAPPAGRPALLFLPEYDTIGPDFHDLCVHGPDLALERDPALAKSCPLVVISPRIPPDVDWNEPEVVKAMTALLDHVNAAVIGLDPDRTSISGTDAGAAGAVALAAADPNRFAAMVWVATRRDFIPPAAADPIRRAFPGRVVTVVPAAGGVAVDSHQPDWTFATRPAPLTPTDTLPVFADRATYDWLARQHRTPK